MSDLMKPTDALVVGRDKGHGVIPEQTPRLGDVRAVAEMIDVSSKTVRRMADAGTIPGVIRIRRLLRFDLAAVSSWIAAGCPKFHNSKVNNVNRSQR